MTLHFVPHKFRVLNSEVLRFEPKPLAALCPTCGRPYDLPSPHPVRERIRPGVYVEEKRRNSYFSSFNRPH